MAETTLDYALAYATKLPGRMLPVVPSGKRPAIGDWVNAASRDESVLARWFSETPDNIGWTPDRGVFVLDIDTKSDVEGRNGFDTLRDLESKFGTLLPTLTATTPTGGKHMLFRCDTTAPVKSIVGSKLGYSGIDIRASTGQIVVAPSTREEGAYRWNNWNPLTEDTPPIADAPQWLVDLACGASGRAAGAAAQGTRRQSSPVGGTDGKVRAGARNATLVTEAGALRRRGWGYDAIVESLTALSECQFEPPCDDREIRDVARWAYGFEPDERADMANARGADDYGTLLDAAGGDAGTVLEVARKLAVDPTLSRTETENLLKRAAKSANVAVKVLRADLTRPADDNTPVIEVIRGDFARSVNSAMDLLPRVPGLRVRSGALVEVAQQGRGAVIAPVNAARLAYLLSSVARWRYGSELGQPDPAVLQAVMAAGGWPAVSELVGLLGQPTIGLDGKLIGDSGNHGGFEATFQPTTFPPYDGTGAEGLAALRGLLTEFPFAAPVDESAALAAILTAVARPMLPTAPAFLVTAADLGSGKTFLARLIGLFGGDAVEMRRWPSRGDEQDKGLLSVLLEGRPTVIYDNLMQHWSSPTLAAILTAPTYSDRVLGGNTTATVSTRSLFVSTGNNVRPAADLSRRVLTIELDARCERPAEREFKGDPVALVQASRGRWVMTALRVLEDFLHAGAAPALTPLASYAEWTRLVRGALVHYGLPDPVRAIQRNVEGDEDRDLLARVLAAWSEAFGPEPLTLREAVTATWGWGAHGALADLRIAFEEVAGERDQINLRKLGVWFRGCAGRIVYGKRLVSGEKTRAGASWQVAAL